MLKTKHVALLYLLSSCLHGQNVVTHWAKIVQPAVNTPPKAPAYQMVQRAVIQIAVYTLWRRLRADLNLLPAASTHRQNRRMCDLQLPLPPGGRLDREWTHRNFLVCRPSTRPIWQACRLLRPPGEASLWANERRGHPGAPSRRRI
jgi:hypothetical protein